MARSGVTYWDVTNAAETLQNQGQKPTVDRVLAHLGTGSKSTIAPLLKRWRLNDGKAIDTEELPNDLLEVVKCLHERLQQLANHKVDQAKTEHQHTIQNIRQELTSTQATITQLTTQKHELEQQLQSAAEDNQSLSQSLNESTIAAEKYQLQLTNTEARITELKALVGDLRQENRDIREHFEHYQQRTAEGRQQEREQFQAATQQLHHQIQQLTAQLSKADNYNAKLLAENNQQQAATETMRSELQKYQEQIAERNTAIHVLNNKVEQTTIEKNNIENKNSLYQKEINSLGNKLSAANKEIEILQTATEQAELALQESKDKISLLDDEYRVVLQEKAVILGQFRQLQGTL